MKKEKHSPYVNISNKEVFNFKTRNLSVEAKLIYILMMIGLRPAMKRCGVFTDIYPQTIRRIVRSLTVEQIDTAIDEIINAGLIVYNKETGDLFVKDWWIRNMIAENPNMLTQYRYHMNSLFYGDEEFRKLAEDNYKQVEERYEADRAAKKKNPYSPNENLSNLCFAAKISTELIWSFSFAQLSIYEQLTYLTLYIGPNREGKAIGFYSNIDELALADLIGGNVDEKQIYESFYTLRKKGFIKYDPNTFDISVPAFVETNIYADSFTAWKYWFDMLTEYKAGNENFEKEFEAAVNKAKDDMLAKHPGIKDQMETKGYTLTFNNKKRNYKFINGDLRIEEEIRQPKYKKNANNEYEEDGNIIVGEGSSVQEADSVIEQDQPIVKKITNDDWMEMLQDKAQPDSEDITEEADNTKTEEFQEFAETEETEAEAEHCEVENEDLYKLLEEVEKQQEKATEEVKETIEAFENIEENQEGAEEVERESELKIETKTNVDFEPWSMITIEALRDCEIPPITREFQNLEEAEETEEEEEEDEAWKYYDYDENDDSDPNNTHSEWDYYN